MESKFTQVREIIKNADETLTTAKAGVAQARSENPAMRRIGLRIAVVFGRSVTFIIQNLRSVVDDFDSWYRPWQERMKNDSLMSYLKDLRNEIEKQGKVNTGITMHIGHLDIGKLMSLVPKRPGATSFFIGDSCGGTGWEVPLPGGDLEKFYVQLPKVPGVELSINLYFANAPEEIRQMPAIEMCEQYVSSLQLLIDDAKQVFLLKENKS